MTPRVESTAVPWHGGPCGGLCGAGRRTLGRGAGPRAPWHQWDEAPSSAAAFCRFTRFRATVVTSELPSLHTAGILCWMVPGCEKLVRAS